MNDDYDTQYEEEVAEREPAFYSVGVYLEELCFGGPEEGGWYYSCFTFTTSLGEHTRSFKTREEARIYRDSLDPLIEEWNEGRPALHSVLSDGRFTAMIVDELPLREYPTERPYYS